MKQSSHDGTVSLTAPTAMVWVATGADEVLVVLLLVSAKAELSKTVENIATMLSNIMAPFYVS